MKARENNNAAVFANKEEKCNTFRFLPLCKEGDVYVSFFFHSFVKAAIFLLVVIRELFFYWELTIQILKY